MLHGEVFVKPPALPLLQMWDVRDLRVAGSRQEAHSAAIRDMDFAPNSPHYLASCGDDCKAKVWDTRWAPFSHHKLQCMTNAPCGNLSPTDVP